MMKLLGALLLNAVVQAIPKVGEVNCRFTSTTSSVVNYYTCSELAIAHGITVEKFFLLNPAVDLECSNISPDTDYCVRGCT